MPRTKRYLPGGQICHVTHRCHDRRFLLKFDKDRRRYRWWLWVAQRRFGVSVLAYCLTANHVHLLLYAPREGAISDLVHLVHGRIGEDYNARKGRTGAFWEQRFHSTLVESGQHLWRCLVYIELNMVRARVVDHPSRWPWCSFAEWRSGRRRHAVLATDALCELLGYSERARFLSDQEAAITDRLRLNRLQREPLWSESIAVGSEAFVYRAANAISNRRNLNLSPQVEADGLSTWSVRESAAAYA